MKVWHITTVFILIPLILGSVFKENIDWPLLLLFSLVVGGSSSIFFIKKERMNKSSLNKIIVLTFGTLGIVSYLFSLIPTLYYKKEIINLIGYEFTILYLSLHTIFLLAFSIRMFILLKGDK